VPDYALLNQDGKTIHLRDYRGLAALKPSLFAVGHGPALMAPSAQMDRAVEVAFQQHPSQIPK
ncbi:MAG: hypothetical protein WAK48_08690, partial [Candidatus Acidiferrum sp.]